MSTDLDLDAAELRRLGPLVSEHPASSRMHKANLIAGICFMVVLGGAAIASLLFYLSSPNGRGFQWVALGLGAVAAAITVAVVFLIRKLKWRVHLHENGVALDRSGQIDVVPWAEVKHFYQREVFANGVREVYLHLYTDDGRKIPIDTIYRDIDDLTGAIRTGVTQAVLNRAAGLLKRGEEVDFGELALSTTGLRQGASELRWNEVAGIDLGHNGVAYTIDVRKNGKKLAWYSRVFVKFPNGDAFMKLAERFTKVTTAE
jgi:hypothetical protein